MSLVRKNNKQEFVVGKSVSETYDILKAAGAHVGVVVSEMPSTGMLRVKVTKIGLVNPTTLRVACESGESGTRVRVDSEALDGMIGVGSAGRCLDAYLEAVDGYASGNPPPPARDATKPLLIAAGIVAVVMVCVVAYFSM